MSQIKVSREAALAKGLKRYFTGLPCKRGHIEERIVSSLACLTCHKERQKKLRDKNPEGYEKAQEKYKDLHYDKILKHARESYHRHKDKRKQNHKNWCENNKKYRQEYKRKDRTKNKGRYREYAVKRNLLLKNGRLQKWFIPETQEIYQNCPFGYEVDHIIPIKHNTVCGLHVPWNLQYLTRQENRSKGNKFNPYYERLI